MPFNLLLLPFLGGYIFVRFWNYTRYHIMRSDKDRLVIRASLVGLLTLIIAYTLKITVSQLIPCEPEKFCLSHWWSKNVPFDYSDVSLLAFIIGAFGWYPLNYWFPKEGEINRVIREDADPFEMMLKRARDEGIEVSITMTNGKVYVGLVTHQFNPSLPTNKIGILPLRSGYRDATTKQMILTTDYSETYEQIADEIDNTADLLNSLETKRHEFLQSNPTARVTEFDKQLKELRYEWDKLERTSNLFEVVIPVGQIASTSFFDTEIHSKYFLPSPNEI